MSLRGVFSLTFLVLETGTLPPGHYGSKHGVSSSPPGSSVETFVTLKIMLSSSPRGCHVPLSQGLKALVKMSLPVSGTSSVQPNRSSMHEAQGPVHFGGG